MSIPIIIEREHLGAIAVSLARRKKQSEGATRSLHDPLLFLFKRRVIAQWKEPKTCAYSYTARPISWLLCRIRCFEWAELRPCRRWPIKGHLCQAMEATASSRRKTRRIVGRMGRKQASPASPSPPQLCKEESSTYWEGDIKSHTYSRD